MDLDKISIESTNNSRAPVEISGFSAPSNLFVTLPSTDITHSDLRSLANEWTFEDNSGLNTICIIPDLSLRSINISWPWSLRLETQPASLIFFSITVEETSPHIKSLCIIPHNK